MGVYDSQGNFIHDAETSGRLAGVIEGLLRASDDDPVGSNAAIGLIFPASADKPWKSPTLLFTDNVVETLYPVHGVRTGVLTTFQKRNREHSIYQGMELLLGYRRETFPDRPVFAPVLFERGTTLGARAERWPDRSLAPEEHDAPAVDVLNLASQIQSDHPDFPALVELCQRITNSSINKRFRKELNFDIDARPADAATTAPLPAGLDSESANPFVANTGPAGGVDFQLDSGTPNLSNTGSAPGSPAEFSQGPATGHDPPADNVQDSGSVFRNPFAEQIDPDLLRRFALFKGLDGSRLGQLAAQLSLDSASPGSQLITRGTADQWFYFLVDGMVVLNAGDGTSRRIEAGSEPASQPLSRLLPRKYDVAAMTAIKFIRVHQSVLEKFIAL